MRHLRFVLPVIVSLALYKAWDFIKRAAFLEAIGWGLFSCVIVWIVWAYANHRDIPSYGSTKYENGSNQIIRTVYVAVMTCIFIFGMVFA